MEKRRNICFLLLSFLSITAFGQIIETVDSVEIPVRYERIILDGDTILRSLDGEVMYNNRMEQINPKTRTVLSPTLSTDWYNTAWDNKKINPFGAWKATYPIRVDFSYKSFTLPVKGQITSRYGWRRGRAHNGIDIDLVTGDNVAAAMDGKVRIASYSGGFGRLVVIRHENGLETFYGHLSKILVQENQMVRSGQIIGKGGNTGRSRGSHLHFETRYRGLPIHPEYLFDIEGSNGIKTTMASISNKWTDPRKHRAYKKSDIPAGTNELYAQNTMPAKQPATPLLTKPVEPLTKTSQSSSSSTSLNKAVVHTVVRGDTLAKIAKKYKSTVSALCSINGISKSTVLQIGQQLKVQ